MDEYNQRHKISKKALLLVIGFVLIGGVGIVLQTMFFQPYRPGDPNDVEQVKRGWLVYAQACARCHGEDLDGEFGSATAEIAGINQELEAEKADHVAMVAPAHDASGQTWRHTDQTLFEIIKFGEAADTEKKVASRMPAFKDKITDDEIWLTIALIKSSWPPEIVKARDNDGGHAIE